MSRMTNEPFRYPATKTRSKGCIVAIVGVDGAGKSTLVRHVESAWKDTNQFPIKTAWCGFSDWKFLDWPFRILRHPKMSGTKSGGRQRREPASFDNVLENRALRFGYYLIVALDYLAQITVKAALPRRAGEIVVCDRYYMDQAVSHSVELRSELALRLFMRLYASVLPAPSSVFVVLVPPEIAVLRKDDIPSKDYVAFRHAEYLKLARTKGYQILDGLTDVDENASIVIHEIESMIGNRDEIQF